MKFLHISYLNVVLLLLISPSLFFHLLSTYQYKAVVFESPYSDFMNPKKVKHYKTSYVVDILSDLAVSFPEIQFIFCGNRKFAREWIYRWFLRINSTNNKNQHI
jgi:hypothetical protein